MKKVVLILLVYVLSLSGCNQPPTSPNEGVLATASPAIGANAVDSLEKTQFSGEKAMQYLVALCKIGPRPTSSDGMKRQQEYLLEYFKPLADKIEKQPFTFPHPLTSRAKPLAAVQGTNLIFRWNPGAKERILLAAHYDTLPFPVCDKRNPRGIFVGANDGASGVAVLMELGTQMSSILAKKNESRAEDKKIGVDFVLFDAEEFRFAIPGTNPRFQLRGDLCEGSDYFAADYSRNAREKYSYSAAVLLDMVGARRSIFRLESYSLGQARLPGQRQILASQRQAGQVMREIWQIAAKNGASGFVSKVGTPVIDDHLPLLRAGIPCIDVIDFAGYQAYWHTTEDTPDKCSSAKMKELGGVLELWLQSFGS